MKSSFFRCMLLIEWPSWILVWEKPIQLGTWIHPATKQTCIINCDDKERSASICIDVIVYRSACCWTDHYLIEGKLMLDFPRIQKNHVTHVSLALHHLRSHQVRDKYQQSLKHYLSQFQCNAEGSVEDQWWILRVVLWHLLRKLLGYARKKQLD